MPDWCLCVILHAAYPTLERLYLVFTPPNVSGNVLCSCPGDARRRGNDSCYFRIVTLFFPFYFATLQAPHRLIAHSTFQLKQASQPVLWFENLLSFQLVIMLAFLLWEHLILNMKTDFRSSCCIFSQTHTHELTKWLCICDKSICCVRGAQGEGCFSWHKWAKEEFYTAWIN